MANYQFQNARILIQPYASAIGPFKFDLSDFLPAGDDAASVTVKSYLNSTETTTDLISSSSLATNIVSVYFKYPGSTKHGIHKLTFQFTLASGGKDEADFYGVEVTSI